MKLFALFTITFLILRTAPEPSFKYKPQATIKLSTDHLETPYAKVWNGFTLGDKRKIPKSIKKDYQRLNLLHLFTPSGLHFSCLLFLISIFLKRRSRSFFMIEVALCLGAWTLPNMWAIKRIALLRLGFLSSRFMKKEVKPFTIFLGVFAADFIFGTYQHSPTSFAYSFLFLGIIFLFHNSTIQLVFGLICAQVFIAFVNGTSLNLVGLVPGQIVTALFSITFPIMLIGGGIAESFGLSYFWAPLRIFHEIVSFTSKNISMFDGFYATGFILILIILMKIKRLKRWSLISISLLISQPIFNFTESAFKKGNKLPAFKLNEKKELIKSSRFYHRGIKVIYKNGRVCNHTLYESTYKRKCKFLSI